MWTAMHKHTPDKTCATPHLAFAGTRNDNEDDHCCQTMHGTHGLLGSWAGAYF